jgi:N-acetylmuramoyl-L-alanine amidase
VVRIAVDLKGEVKSNLFALAPAGDYKHRLVLDIYPLQDELMAMLGKKSAEENQSESTEKPVVEPLPPNVDATEDPAIEPMPPTKKDEIPTADKDDERLITIALDAGHGGEDPGARGANGSREKHITLQIAKKLKEKIDAEPNMRAVLTRDGDYFVPLATRVVKARKFKADLFVSIHADAFTNKSARGSSVFALSEKGATSASARYLAKKENESDSIGGVSLGGRDPVLAKTLLDLSQAATINDSLKLGKAVLGHIGEINKLHKTHVEQAGFAVLKSPDIPSILVETAFISNPDEERKLNDDDHQDRLADSILSGIKKYFASNPALAKTKIAKE